MKQGSKSFSFHRSQKGVEDESHSNPRILTFKLEKSRILNKDFKSIGIEFCKRGNSAINCREDIIILRKLDKYFTAESFLKLVSKTWRIKRSNRINKRKRTIYLEKFESHVTQASVDRKWVSATQEPHKNPSYQSEHWVTFSWELLQDSAGMHFRKLKGLERLFR